MYHPLECKFWNVYSADKQIRAAFQQLFRHYSEFDKHCRTNCRLMNGRDPRASMFEFETISSFVE